jgi:hypothetical protein
MEGRHVQCRSVLRPCSRFVGQAFELRNKLTGIIAGSGKLDKEACVAITLRRQSVSLCRGDGVLFRAGVRMLARVSERSFQLRRQICDRASSASVLLL